MRRPWQPLSLDVRATFLLSCLLLSVPYDIRAMQVRLPETTIVLELEINEKVRGLKPEHVPIAAESQESNGEPAPNLENIGSEVSYLRNQAARGDPIASY